MNTIEHMAGYLVKWRMAHAGDTKGWCARAMRFAAADAEKELPQEATALLQFKALDAHPGVYGWKRAIRDAKGRLPAGCLVYFTNCGWVQHGKLMAGHVALVIDNRVMHDNIGVHKFTWWWKWRVRAAFISA